MKGIFSGVLLASDFDGTVFGSITGMPQRNLEAVSYFMEEGGVFVIATGRTYVTFAPHCQVIPSNAPTILSNGAAIYDFQQEKLLSLTQLPETAKEDVITLCEVMPSLAFEAYYQEKIYAHNPNHITDSHMKIVGETYEECAISEMPCPWVKLLIQEEREVLLEARAFLQQRRPQTYETIFSNPRYLEVTAKGVNKGSAVLHVAKDLGISPQHIYCVGDNENDLSMLALSAVPFAPSTSAEVVLATNPEILCSCEEGVLGALIPRLEQRYKGGTRL